MQYQAITLLDGLKHTLDDELAASGEDEKEEVGDNHDDDDDSSDSNDEEYFIAIFPFEPSAENELKLEVGDLIDVLKTNETGWWKGRCLRTDLDGWFPSTYVKVRKTLISCLFSLTPKELFLK